MDYSFDWTWFGIGVIVLLCSGAAVLWHRQIADNIGGGVGSYERYRLWALIGCAIGLIAMLNLHVLILNFIFGLVFGRGDS